MVNPVRHGLSHVVSVEILMFALVHPPFGALIMATRSTISVEIEPGIILSAYCHFNGAENADTLTRHYAPPLGPFTRWPYCGDVTVTHPYPNYVSIKRCDAIAHLASLDIEADPDMRQEFLEALMDRHKIAPDHDGYYVVEPEYYEEM